MYYSCREKKYEYFCGFLVSANLRHMAAGFTFVNDTNIHNWQLQQFATITNELSLTTYVLCVFASVSPITYEYKKHLQNEWCEVISKS